MSIGNLKTDGGKGTNWPWQYKMLLGLDKIIATIKTDGKDYESDLVSIACAGPVPPAGTVLRLEVRVFDTTTGAFTSISYYEPGSIVADPADYSGCTITYLEAGDATEATLQAILTKNTEIETTANAILADTDTLVTSNAAILTKNGEIEVTADAILAMNTDIEAKTTLVVANTDEIKADVGDILSNTNELKSNTNAPTMLRAAAAGPLTIAAVVKSISFYNASATDTAHVLTVDLKPGETVNFDAGGNGNVFPASTFTYDPDTTGGGAGDLLIIYVV